MQAALLARQNGNQFNPACDRFIPLIFYLLLVTQGVFQGFCYNRKSMVRWDFLIADAGQASL
jgi:hypothetical protein